MKIEKNNKKVGHLLAKHQLHHGWEGAAQHLEGGGGGEQDVRGGDAANLGELGGVGGVPDQRVGERVAEEEQPFLALLDLPLLLLNSHLAHDHHHEDDDKDCEVDAKDRDNDDHDHADDDKDLMDDDKDFGNDDKDIDKDVKDFGNDDKNNDDKDFDNDDKDTTLRTSPGRGGPGGTTRSRQSRKKRLTRIAWGLIFTLVIVFYFHTQWGKSKKCD